MDTARIIEAWGGREGKDDKRGLKGRDDKTMLLEETVGGGCTKGRADILAGTLTHNNDG